MRKGQAAMEFLMTYGWAILVVLAAIGALAYFGVLSPDRFLPDKCTANPPFACTEYKVSEAGDSVYMRLQNSAGVNVNITDVKLKCVTATSSPESWASATVNNGDTLAMNWTTKGTSQGNYPDDCSTISNGGKFKATYDITYINSGETVSHTGSGSIQVRAEA